jgi:hypothetical protein
MALPLGLNRVFRFIPISPFPFVDRLVTVREADQLSIAVRASTCDGAHLSVDPLPFSGECR